MSIVLSFIVELDSIEALALAIYDAATPRCIGIECLRMDGVSCLTASLGDDLLHNVHIFVCSKDCVELLLRGFA